MSIRKRRFATVLAMILVVAVVALPMVAFAQEATPIAAPVDTPEAAAARVEMTKYIVAGSAMALSAIAAAYAQAKIGVAAAGTLAERPEVATMLIVLEALPEIIVLLGFVSALIISG